MKKIVSMALALFMITTMLTACGGSSSTAPKDDANTDSGAADGKVYTFKMANQAPPGDPQYDSFVYLEEILEERSGGRIDVTYYPNSTMGSSNQEQTEMTMSGDRKSVV